MTDNHPRIHCTVVTPEARVIDVTVLDVVFPAHDGLMGVLPEHAPMLCNLGSGLLKYRTSEASEERVYIEGGFGHIRDNEVTILTRTALTWNMITETQAKEEFIAAQDMPATNTEEIEARSAAIHRAKCLLLLSEGR